MGFYQISFYGIEGNEVDLLYGVVCSEDSRDAEAEVRAHLEACEVGEEEVQLQWAETLEVGEGDFWHLPECPVHIGIRS